MNKKFYSISMGAMMALLVTVLIIACNPATMPLDSTIINANGNIVSATSPNTERWEYMHKYPNNNGFNADMTQWLNGFAADGWEFVTYVYHYANTSVGLNHHAPNDYVIFKRRLP